MNIRKERCISIKGWTNPDFKIDYESETHIFNSYCIAIETLILSGNNIFITVMDHNLDLVASEAVLHMMNKNSHVSLIVILPYSGIGARFEDCYFQRYTNIMKSCSDLIFLGDVPSKELLFKAYDYMFENSCAMLYYQPPTHKETHYLTKKFRDNQKRVIMVEENSIYDDMVRY